MPYAAAVTDPELSERSGAVDQGIEHGLATAAATDQADVAYTLPKGGPAAVEAAQPPPSASDAPEASQDIDSLPAAPADTPFDSEVCSFSTFQFFNIPVAVTVIAASIAAMPQFDLRSKLHCKVLQPYQFGIVAFY